MYEGIDDRLERAARGTRIADLPREALIDRLSGILSGTYILVGFQLPAISDITLLTAKLATDLLESYAFLSVEEVELCFELGARGQYGDFAGLNLRTFHRWLRIYKTSEARYRLVTRRETTRAALPATTPGHKRACEDRLLQKAFATYRERRDFERLLPVHLYGLLQERGLIADTPEEKRAAMARFANHGGQAARRPPAGFDFQVKRQAMEWLLARYFDRLIANGQQTLAL